MGSEVTELLAQCKQLKQSALKPSHKINKILGKSKIISIVKCVKNNFQFCDEVFSRLKILVFPIPTVPWTVHVQHKMLFCSF